MTKKLLPLFIVVLLLDGMMHKIFAANDIDCVAAFNTCMEKKSCTAGYEKGYSSDARNKCSEELLRQKAILGKNGQPTDDHHLDYRAACLKGCNFWWQNNRTCRAGQVCPN